MKKQIVQLLDACNAAFASVCNNFNFYKYHKITHCPTQAKWFANLDVLDANR
jgi:hypothetical protein